MIRRLWSLLLIVVVLGLDWAALHDILKGEPNTWMEWIFVLASPVFFWFMYQRMRRTKES